MQINLYTLIQEKLSFNITNLNRDKDEMNITFIEMTLNAPFTIYEKIKAEALFNFHQAVRNQEAHKFNPDKPVDLKVRIRPHFITTLNEADCYDDSDIFLKIQQEEEAFVFINQTESWLLWSVTQIEDLPTELEEIGTLKLGIKSKYGAKVEEQTNETINPIDVATAFFYENGQSFDTVNPKTLKTTVEQHDSQWNVLVFHNERENITIVYSVLPKKVQSEYRALMAEMLIKINYDLGVGAFEMDTDDGEVRFRTAIGHTDDRLSPALFENLFSINIRTMASFIEKLLMKIG
jgi:hypothetical protein